MRRMYFDNASTTPVDPQVIKAMEPYFFEQFGNPSSPHFFGRDAKKALENSRDFVANFLGASSQEIVFGSGGTEANNHALIGVARRLKSKGNHIIISAVEHHSILEPAFFLQKEGFKLTILEVDSTGRVDPNHLRQSLTDQTILVSTIHANNEIGTIQPIREIGAILKERLIHFHVDGVQTVGHLPVDVNHLGCDSLSIAAHKFYGPKGVGALYIRKNKMLDRFLLGGDQERGYRASTQNVASAVGMAHALKLCQQSMNEEAQTQTQWRDEMIRCFKNTIAQVTFNGHSRERLPNNVHMVFDGLEGESLLMSLDSIGIAASMGSACRAGALAPSHVLKAIGLTDEQALGALRISLGRFTTVDEVDFFIKQLPELVKRLRQALK